MTHNDEYTCNVKKVFFFTVIPFESRAGQKQSFNVLGRVQGVAKLIK